MTHNIQQYSLPESVFNHVDENNIAVLVHCFYDRVMQDKILQPVFGKYISDDAWPEHLKTMCDFWSNVLLRTHRYSGRPMPAHFKISEIAPAHFSEWLTLFGQTCFDVFDAEIAEAIYQRAENIAESFRLGLNYAGRDGF